MLNSDCIQSPSLEYNAHLAGADMCGDLVYWVPITAGSWGGYTMSREGAELGRGLASQLLGAQRSMVCFNLQGGACLRAA
jgi:hypothetical protein